MSWCSPESNRKRPPWPRTAEEGKYGRRRGVSLQDKDATGRRIVMKRRSGHVGHVHVEGYRRIVRERREGEYGAMDGGKQEASTVVQASGEAPGKKQVSDH